MTMWTKKNGKDYAIYPTENGKAHCKQQTITHEINREQMKSKWKKENTNEKKSIRRAHFIMLHIYTFKILQWIVRVKLYGNKLV